jgi:hypothetical protein
MRKILSLLGGLFLILILVFTFMHFNMKRSFYNESGHYNGRMMKPEYSNTNMMSYRSYEDMGIDMFQKFTPEEGERYIKIKSEILKIYTKYGLEINKKKLDVEAELLRENPDWEKIQKMNDEIALMESKVKTEIMKINYINR